MSYTYQIQPNLVIYHAKNQELTDGAWQCGDRAWQCVRAVAVRL